MLSSWRLKGALAKINLFQVTCIDQLLIHLAAIAQIARHSFFGWRSEGTARSYSKWCWRPFGWHNYNFHHVSQRTKRRRWVREEDKEIGEEKFGGQAESVGNGRPARAPVGAAGIPHACLVLKLTTQMLDLEQLQVYSTGPVWRRRIWCYRVRRWTSG